MTETGGPEGNTDNPASGMAAAAGVRWMMGSQLFSQFVATGMNIALAWVLTRGDIGLMAVATVVTALVDELTNLGTGQAVIQRQELSRRTIDAVFSLNLLIGCSLAGAIFVFADQLAVLAGGSSAAAASSLLKILAFSVAVKSLAIVHLALLRRNLRFAPLGVISIVGSLAHLAVTLSCAIGGLGAASMAYGSLTGSLISFCGATLVSRQPVRFRLKRSELAPIFGFSANLTLSNLFGFFTRNIDRSLVARMLGLQAAGVYQVGVRTLRTPIVTLTSTVNGVLMPVLARLQHDPEEQGRRFLQATAGLALLVFPAMTGLAIVADHLVAVILSAEWADAGSVIAWMALVGMLRTVAGLMGPMVTANGRTGVQLGLNVLIGSALIASYFVTTRISLDAVVIGILVVHVVVVPIQLSIVLRMSGIGWPDYVRALAPALGVAVVTSLCAGGTEWLLQDAASDLVTLAASVLAGAGIGLVVVLVSKPSGFRELAVIAGRRIGRS